MVEFAAALSETPRDELAGPALEAVIEGWLAFCEGLVVRWLAERDLERDAVLTLLRHALLAGLGSVAAVDARPGPARLAAAAAQASTISAAAEAGGAGRAAGGATLAGAGRPETNT
jgi:hypothetical protein